MDGFLGHIQGVVLRTGIRTGVLSGAFPGDLLSRCLAGVSYKLPVHKIVNGDIYRCYKLLQCERVVEPGIDLDVFVHQPRPMVGPQVVVGCIGRKLAWKGTREIVEAVEQVRRSTGKDLILNIAFELPEGLDMNQYGFVRVFQPHGDIALAGFYRQVDVFVATGLLQDGAFHYPCLEAMASGCAVISNYGPATQASAFCVNSVDKHVIAEALMRYLAADSADLNAMKACAAKAVGRHGWPQTGDRMLAYFRES